MESEPSFEPLERLLAHEPFVRALARSLIEDAALAEDAAQDAWVAALEGAPAGLRSPKAWLARVVRNFAFRSGRAAGRRARRERGAARPEALPSTEEIVGREEARRRLVETVLSLEEPYRRTVLLRYFEALPPREIARRSGIPVGTVGTRLRRAHARLRERLDAEHGGDRRAWCLALAPFAFGPPVAPAGPGLSMPEVALMKASTKAALGAAALLAAAGMVALLPRRANEGPGRPDSKVAASRGPARPAAKDQVNPPQDSTPLRRPATATEPSAPGPARVEVQGRLVVRGGGPLGESTVAVRTGDDAIDFPETVSRLGGPDALGELKHGYDGPAGLDEAVGDVGGWKAAFETAAAAEGSFALAIPSDLPEFRFEVKADFALYDSDERFRPDDPRLREGVTLLLDPAGKVEGSIRTASGSPPRNGRVSRFDVGQGMRLRAEAADANGRFAIRGLGPGRHSFGAGGEGGGPVARLDVAVRAGGTTRLDFDLPAESWISGRVLDGNGRGIAGAVLEARGGVEIVRGIPADWFHGLRHGRSRTGAGGRFRIGSLLPGVHAIQVSAEGFLPGFRGPIEVPAGGGSEGVEIVLESGHRITGRVVDAERRPAEGLAVIVVPDLDAAKRRNLDDAKLRSFRQRASTAADGSFSISGLDAAPLIVLVRKGGTPLAERREVEPDTEGLELVVGRPTGIAGSVRDSSGNPLQSFRIVPLRVVLTSFGGTVMGREGEERPGREFCSEDGSFEWTGLETGTFDFRAEARGLVARTLADVEVTPGETRRGLEFRLEPGATILGRAVERGTGAAVTGARVDVLPEDRLSPDRRRRGSPAANTGEDGTFEVSGLPPGGTRLVIAHEDFVEVTTVAVEGRAGETVEGILVELPRGGVVEGLAVGEDGVPFARGSAVAIPSQFRGGMLRGFPIDEQGRFRIGGLASGRYRVEANPKWAGSTPYEEIEKRRLSTLVDVEEGKVATVEFYRPPRGGAVVRGRVVQGGEGVLGLVVRVEPLASRHDPEESFARYQQLKARSGEDGAFRIEGVPEGEAKVSVQQIGGSARIAAGLSVRRRIHVPAEGEVVCDFSVPSGVISGRVVSGGSPVAGIFVHASRVAALPDDTEWSVNDMTDEGGRYSLGCLPAGSYAIFAGGRTRGMDRPTDEVLPTTKEARLTEGGRAVVDFEVEHGGTALVEVRGPSGSPAAGVRVWVGPVAGAREGLEGGAEWVTDRGGLARVKGLRPGFSVATVLRASPFAATFSDEKEVRLEEEARFTLDLREGTRVRVRVVDGTGAPLGTERVILRDSRGWAIPAQSEGGAWTVVVLPGDYAVEVSAPSRERKSVPARVGDAPVDLEIGL
ncbi:MAG TPA: sigma-70 family RNA polymerase sigma factor [Planctomycetota bacterium]|jgi:RNA polymerase sigma-70 factor (ECF subfamily)|nr:sigma-70 family RNA polymerase sigma factor [Planctomycetota bacterium]